MPSHLFIHLSYTSGKVQLSSHKPELVYLKSALGVTETLFYVPYDYS
jgi:hypothetical protein